MCGPASPSRDDAGMTGPTGGERATQRNIALARCDRLPCWWRGSRLDTRPRLPRPCCERFGPHPLDPSFQRRLASRLPAGRSLLRHGCFDLFTDEEGGHRSLVRRPHSRNGEKGHAPHPISPGGAFRGAVNPVCFNRQRGQRGARRIVLIDWCYAKNWEQQSS